MIDACINEESISVTINDMLGMFNIKFSAIPAVSLLMSVGISVEFVAHFVLAFLMEFEGTRNDRVRITYIRMLPLVSTTQPKKQPLPTIVLFSKPTNPQLY